MESPGLASISLISCAKVIRTILLKMSRLNRVIEVILERQRLFWNRIYLSFGINVILNSKISTTFWNFPYFISKTFTTSSKTRLVLEIEYENNRAKSIKKGTDISANPKTFFIFFKNQATIASFSSFAFTRLFICSSNSLYSFSVQLLNASYIAPSFMGRNCPL